MSRSVSSIMVCTLCLWPIAAPAQDGPADFDSLRAGLAGTEVMLDGYIGTGLEIMDDEAINFVVPSDRATFAVVFDAGRDARRQLEGCVFNSFTGGTPCRITGRAELEWDGGRLRLILFALDTIAPPAGME